MAFVRTASGVCVANLHATNDWPKLAAEDVVKAARARRGGRPARRSSSAATSTSARQAAPGLRTAAEEFGLAQPTAPDAIDHILCRGLEVVEPPRAWPPEQRELPLDGRALRLSDHAPVQARFHAAEPHALRN